MIKTSLFGLILALISTSITYSQSRCVGVTGRVTSTDGWLVVAADVKIKRNGRGESIDVKGNADAEYSACLPDGWYEITAVSPGYNSLSRRIKIDKGTSIVDFVLSHKP